MENWTVKELLICETSQYCDTNESNGINNTKKSVFEIMDEIGYYESLESILTIKVNCLICNDEMKMNLTDKPKIICCNNCKKEAEKEIIKNKLKIKLDEHLHNIILSNKLASDD